MRTRFAPSPTGWLHIGHARAASETFGWAEAHGAECLLRIEDTDATRCRPEYTRGIFDDLSWLGFEWPVSPPLGPVRVQSEHLPDYEAVADTLRDMGVLYPCAMSRREVAARTVDGVFRGEPVPGPDAPWRLDVRAALERTGPLTWSDDGITRAVEAARISDDILVRRDTGTSYHVAVTHDDALQGITHVVRGLDLRDATPLHRILQALMGWPKPRYLHHGLVMDGDRKLSKRDGDTAIRHLREAGATPEEVLALAGVGTGD